MACRRHTFDELEVSCEAFFHFGSYDQLNGGACASAEVLVRRIFGIVDALSSATDRASWHNAQYFVRGTSADDLVPMEMKTCVSRRAKEDNEVLRIRSGKGGNSGADAGGGGDMLFPVEAYFRQAPSLTAPQLPRLHSKLGRRREASATGRRPLLNV